MKHRNDLTKTESRRLCLLLLNMAIIAGIAAGAAVAAMKRGSGMTDSLWLHQFFAPVYSGNTVLDVFKNTFVLSGIYLAAVFILGFFSFGQPLGIILLAYRGFGIGVSVAQMYILSGMESLPAVLAMLLPKALALSFIASLGVREMLKLSCALFSFLFKDELPDEKMVRTVKLYAVKFLVLLFLSLLVSIADSALNYIFMDLY